MNNFDILKNKTLIELEERLRISNENYNNKFLSEEIDYEINKNTYLGGNEYFISDKDEIVYKVLENKSIIHIKYQSINDITIAYCTFNKCFFKDLVFRNCNIHATFFIGCTFDNVVFEHCKFINNDNEFVVFKDRNIFIKSKFENCNLEKSIFIDMHICDSRFELSNLKGVIINESNINNLHISDCDMRGSKLINYKVKSISFEDEYLTKLSEDSFFDEIEIKRNGTYKVNDMYKIYKDIAIKFEANRLPNKSGEYYYLYKKSEYKTLKGFEKVKSYLYWMLCGYGEKPTYALITSIEIVLIFTILYMFTGLSIGIDIIDYDVLILKNLPTDGLILDFLKSMYFSVVTFTTVGYGDITPIGLSVFLSGIEMFLGVTMVGIWTATLARKITR